MTFIGQLPFDAVAALNRPLSLETVVQQQLPVGGSVLTLADLRQTVVGPGHLRSFECWLYGVQQPSCTLNLDGAVRLTASPSPGLAVSTPRSLQT